MKNYDLRLGNCLDVLKEFPDNSIDSCVTDPPYGLNFMNKKWDYDVPSVAIWEQVYRVLKPGGHLLSFFGTRTYHRGVINIEDAGFEIRDQLQWLYGQGFPKSHDVSKGIDKKLGMDRKIIGVKQGKSGENLNNITRPDGNDDISAKGLGAYGQGAKQVSIEIPITAPASDEAKQWVGWGTALKPANEPIVLARKPLGEDTVAENVMKFSVGGLNIDGCKIGVTRDVPSSLSKNKTPNGVFGVYGSGAEKELNPNIGRWPANVIHDGSEEVLSLLPSTSKSASVKGTEPSSVTKDIYGKFNNRTSFEAYGDEGTVARFFYCAKTSKTDREEGLELEKKLTAASEFRPNHMEKTLNGETGNPYGRWTPLKNNHPTVKPTDLMRYLCRLVTPKDGTVLDPFMGSGSTGKACMKEGFKFIGIEMDENYLEIAEGRIKNAVKHKGLEEFWV